MPDLSPDVERELEALDDALAGRRVAPDLTELGELALLLREDRPQPTDGFGRSLDNRVERGFPGRDPRTRASGRRWLTWQGWMAPALGVTATAVLVAVIAVSGPHGGESGGGGGAASTAEESSGAGGAAAAGGARSSAEDAAGGGSGGDEAASAAPAPQSVAPAPSPGTPGVDGREQRKVERSASLTLATRPRYIDGVSARIQEVTREQGGFVVTSSVSSSTGGGGGTFELRIPTRNLDDAIAALSRLAAVRERAQRAQDITAQSVSARSRLKDAKTERQSLLKQLADATTVPETESIRARLRLVSAEIERARAEVRRVNNRAAFSTVAVTLVADRSAAAPGAEEENGSWTPGDAAHDALRVLEVIAGVALIAAAIAVPLALVGLLAATGLRFTRRRRREHALDAI
jgi:Domain of unknown function (DUF4349)